MTTAPKSMTGYARIQGFEGAMSWVWEIKTVNSRGLEIRTRLPQGMDALDLRIRDVLQKRMARGNVSVSLNWTQEAQKRKFVVNEALLTSYVKTAIKLNAAYFGQIMPASIEGLMGLRGVIEETEAELAPMSEASIESVMAGFSDALAAVIAMRESEGERLGRVLSGQLGQIAVLIDEAATEAARDRRSSKDRIKEQVALLIGAEPGLSEDRLLQEAALLAAKADIQEELDRSRSHLAAARDMLADSGPVGRKLDFLCQEFNREANTVCSKSGQKSLARIGMNLKVVIEQFREQVQNIE